MADARYIIEQSFRALVLEKPYKQITVSDICERSYLSRKSFYTYFDNKESVLSEVFINDVIRPMREINHLFTKRQAFSMQGMLYEKIYTQIYENADFYSSLVLPMAGRDDTFLKVATKAIYDLNRDIFKDTIKLGDETKTDYISYFFASSQAMLVQKWVSDGMPYSPEELADLYNSMTHSFWTSVMDANR